MDLDGLLLARIQFAFTITFHIIFPAFTIGLASFLAMLEFRWLTTKDPIYRTLYRFWVKVFAVSFGLGVVSGITMSYQFGTNWSRFSDVAGNVVGPLIAYEVMTAFFLEAAFLGIMLFGWQKVGDRLHFVSTVMVALGTLLSAFWILSANSWMQTPAGHAMQDGVAVPVDWWQIVFNPSFPLRFAHMVLGAYLTTAFTVAGLSAYMLLRGRGDPHERREAAARSLSMALWFATIFVPVQIFVGDMHGLAVLRLQPTKLAAIEANWETRSHAPLVLFAWPNERTERNDYEVAIPGLGSLILTHRADGVVPGLRDVPPADRPPVPQVFFAFRIMVAMGMAMLALTLWSLWLRWRRRLVDDPWFLRAAFAMTPSGFIAVVFGWYTAEIGRQPWVIYGVLRTADAVSPVAPGAVAASLAAFVIAYTVIFTAGTYYLFKLLKKGPDPVEPPLPEELGKRPKRPLSAAEQPLDRPAHSQLPIR